MGKSQIHGANWKMPDKKATEYKLYLYDIYKKQNIKTKHIRD